MYLIPFLLNISRIYAEQPDNAHKTAYNHYLGKVLYPKGDGDFQFGFL